MMALTGLNVNMTAGFSNRITGIATTRNKSENGIIPTMGKQAIQYECFWTIDCLIRSIFDQ
jgi:hypothetical protein